MLARSLRLFCLMSCLLLSVSAQEGHPAKGTWVGYWGQAKVQQNRLVVVMDHDGKNITGTINPGTEPIPIKMARLDIIPASPTAKPMAPDSVPTFKLHIEAEGKDAKGNFLTIVADGTMENTGLPSRTLVGTWIETSAGKAAKGNFQIRRQ